MYPTLAYGIAPVSGLLVSIGINYQEALILSEFINIVEKLSIPKPAPVDIKKINIGKDGLMCEYEGMGGLLLPQVASENKWDGEEFLRQLCYKAGLNPDAWRQDGFKLWKFTAKIIKEENLEA